MSGVFLCKLQPHLSGSKKEPNPLEEIQLLKDFGVLLLVTMALLETSAEAKGSIISQRKWLKNLDDYIRKL